jgi:hypothetical protein
MSTENEQTQTPQLDYIKNKLSDTYQGNMDVSTLYFKIDVLTKDEVIVIEDMSNWVNGVGYLTIHSTQFPNKKKHLHLYNIDSHNSDNVHKIITFCANYEINLTLEQ